MHSPLQGTQPVSYADTYNGRPAASDQPAREHPRLDLKKEQ